MKMWEWCGYHDVHIHFHIKQKSEVVTLVLVDSNIRCELMYFPHVIESLELYVNARCEQVLWHSHA